MGTRGLRERRSPAKAAAVRANARRPRKGHVRPGRDPETRDLAKAAIAKMQDLWPFCQELTRQIIHDDMRDARGNPLQEDIRIPVYDGSGRQVGWKVSGKRRFHVPLALRLSTLQDLFDRTGFSREVTQRIAGELSLPDLGVQLVGFPKPTAVKTETEPQLNVEGFDKDTLEAIKATKVPNGVTH